MKMIRKICLWLLVVVTLALPAAASASEVTLNASATTVEAGDTFTVTAVMEKKKSVALGTVALDYDEKAFELVSGQCLLDNAMFGEVLVSEKAGTFLLMLPRKVSGEIFTFTLRVKDGAPSGSYTIGAEASFGDDQASAATVKGASVTIASAYVPTEEPDDEPAATQPSVNQTPSQGSDQLPTQSQEQTETTDSDQSARKQSNLWWLVIPAVVCCGIAGWIIWKKKKA